MQIKTLLTGVSLAVCLAAVWAVAAQRHHLAGLKVEQDDLLARLTRLTETAPAAEVNRAQPATPSADVSGSTELLRLRNEVTSLTQQRGALSAAQRENERLRTELAARATNSANRVSLPGNIIRRTEARMVGYNSAEDTLQSMLWAVQNHDFATMLQAMTPETAQKIQADLQRPGGRTLDDFFKQAEKLMGMAIVSQRRVDDGTIEAQMMVFMHGQAEPHTADNVRFQQINGQWRFVGPL